MPSPAVIQGGVALIGVTKDEVAAAVVVAVVVLVVQVVDDVIMVVVVVFPVGDVSPSFVSFVSLDSSSSNSSLDLQRTISDEEGGGRRRGEAMGSDSDPVAFDIVVGDIAVDVVIVDAVVDAVDVPSKAAPSFSIVLLGVVIVAVRELSR